MLLTNGSSSAREKYLDTDLLSIVNFINTASVSRITLGYYIFSIRYRFAGLVNPSVPLRELVLKDQEHHDSESFVSPDIKTNGSIESNNPYAQGTFKMTARR
jgi:hypothetical protein